MELYARKSYLCEKGLIMKKTITLFMLLCAITSMAQSPRFEDFFIHKTLRVDYLFSGNKHQQEISIANIYQLDKWAGRHHNLDKLPLKGYGEVCMTDFETGQIIYRTSFSTLFQEWLTTDEANNTRKGFENTYLFPFPLKKVIIEVKLYGDHGEQTAYMKHSINPEDILIKKIKHNTPEYKYILSNGTPEECIDIAILAEGYTADEKEIFYNDARITCESLFEHEPFKHLKNKFNVVAVASTSAESGVSIPRKQEWKKTAFGSHFDTFYSERYLTTGEVFEIHNTLSNIPYEHIIILANTNTYGGGGIYNAFTLTTAHHEMFKPVVVHEFGHSFGGLGDEYFYEDDLFSNTSQTKYEPWEPNVTTLVDFENKWKDMLPGNSEIPSKENPGEPYKIGVYEGARYSAHGVYRPAYDCRMKTNTATQFCPVCQRAIERIINFYTENK